MRRTELIPQTTAAIGAGMVYYHFSMMRSDTNAPSEFREHQIAFFESHFTEMKSGWMSGASGTSDALLRWDVSSSTEWNTTWVAGVWHNVAYGIDFDAETVAFYHSTGADDLTLTVPAVPCTASSNGADWHLGVLELPRDGYADADEDIYFSGVYVESGDLTTGVSGPGGSSAASSGSLSSSIAPALTMASVALSSTVLAVSSSILSQTEAASASTTSVATSSSVEIAASSSTAPVISSTTTAAAIADLSTASSSSMPSATAEAAGEEDDCY